MYYTEYDDERPRWWKPVAAAVVVALVAAIAFWQLNSDSDSASGGSGEAGTTTPATPTPSSDVTPPASAPSEETDGTTPSVDDEEASTTAPRREASASTTVTTEAESEPATGASGSSGASTTAVASSPPVPAASLGYPTSPDGTPLPIVVIFDTETITITGQVPSQAAKDRLAALAVANSKFPDAELIDNMVINPAVPISIGTRVIELNSARFPEGSAEIMPEHALELDRVVSIMNALPAISVLVIGHADQRGDDLRNFAISDERARAVVNYLLYLGVSPTRLASRAAGETDLLTLDDDDTALALNRRTEFIFYGLLIG